MSLLLTCPLISLADSESASILQETTKVDAIDNISLNVPSRTSIITAPIEEEYLDQGGPVSFERVLKLIPSYKYFKVIMKEYSSRSASYNGQDNLMAPFM
jgi:hypothetical protein